MLEYRGKVTYSNELDRIRGYISTHDTRFPIGTIESSEKREEELKKSKEIEDFENYKNYSTGEPNFSSD